MIVLDLGAAAPTVGAGGLVSLFVIAVMRGKLVPRKTMEDVLKERDDWKAAHALSEQARLAAAGQVEELLEHARTTDAFIRALPAAIRGQT